MKIFVLGIISILVLSSCSNKTMEANEAKLDAPLRSKLKELSQDASKTRIGIIGKCYEDINDNLKADLAATGAGVQTIIKNIFTAEASADEISRLSNLNIVITLELSQKSELK